jgi:hypothetical protein
MATPSIRKYIRRQFRRLATKNDLRFVIEKTCANSLRVGFVDRVLPEAKYIFIRRNGFDAIASATKRWTADLDLPYLFRKARFVPISDLPYYATRYARNRCYRLVARERRVAYWGPRFDGLDEVLKSGNVDEVSAIQWKRCVESAADAFETMPEDKYIDVEYERFVREPTRELKRIVDFVGLPADACSIRTATEGVTNSSVGLGRGDQDRERTDRIRPLIEDVLRRFGYE